MIRTAFISSIHDINPDDWNATLSSDYPFTKFEFLAALEDSGSVGEKTGWEPQHLVMLEDDKPVATLPAYIKHHSYGEYVFDWSWADAYHRHGLSYYPKLLAAIPFTPATGPRLNTSVESPEKLVPLASRALAEHAERLGCSGHHILFPSQQERPGWSKLYAERLGCQFHWFNQNFRDFDDFLATFASRKRKNLKKERQRVIDQGVTLKRFSGEAITPELWDSFYHFYQITYAKRSGHGGYLTKEFFRLIGENMKNQLLLVMAFQGDQAIAGALNFFSSTTLFGRYWGAIRDIDGLHFEACYYQGIEFCIEQGLACFDPGAQGEHKIQRGFTPILTHSYHHLRHEGFNAAIKEFIEKEAVHTQEYQKETSNLLPFKNKPEAS